MSRNVNYNGQVIELDDDNNGEYNGKFLNFDKAIAEGRATPIETTAMPKPNIAPPDATNRVIQGFKDAVKTGENWNILPYTKMADDGLMDRPYLRPLAMMGGAMADVGLMAVAPFRHGLRAMGGKLAGTGVERAGQAMKNAAIREINTVSTKSGTAQGVLRRLGNFGAGAVDGVIASGDASPETALVGALFGAGIGGNAAANAARAERELAKFANAPSYQQRWAKNYLRANGITANDNPMAIRQLIKKEFKAGENIDDVILRNDDRLQQLNSDMNNLLEVHGKQPIGMSFPDFANDIKEKVYFSGINIGNSEGEKLERAIGFIVDDIRKAQIIKNLVNEGNSISNARKILNDNTKELLENTPLTLRDVDELKRAMQKRSSIYQRSSNSQARAGTETMANAEGSAAINNEIDLLREIPEEIREEADILQKQFGINDFSKLADALANNVLNNDKAKMIESKLFGEILDKYRTINGERTDLIGKNKIFETMKSKFERVKPDDTFTPNPNNVIGSKLYNTGLSALTRGVKTGADILRTGGLRNMLPNAPSTEEPQ